MRKVVILISAFLFNAGVFSQNDNDLYSNPIRYNDYIIDIVNGIDYDYEQILSVDSQAIQRSKLHILATNVESGLVMIKRLKPFKEDASFRSAALEFMLFMKQIAIKDMPDFLNIIWSDDINSTKNQNRLDVLIPLLDVERPAKFQHIVKIQKAFAIKFDYKIENQ